MTGSMFLSKIGRRVDAQDYQNRTNHAESAKLGRDILQRFGERKRTKTGRCTRSCFVTTALLTQSAVFQHWLNLRIVSAPLAIKFS